MRIVIDKHALVFLPIKHPDLYVCANLAWIECYPTQPYYITTMDETFLKGFSELDIMILYKHTTQETATSYGQKLRRILFELADRIPVRECNAFEVDMQASKVPEIRAERYLYNPGSMLPMVQHNLFELEPLRFPKAPNENEIGNTPPPVRPSAPIHRAATTPAPGPSAGRVAAPSAPRQPGVAGVVWAVADKHWESAGKPTDTKILLALRRKIMDDLEHDHSVKRVTSSNELGKWMKTKI